MILFIIISLLILFLMVWGISIYEHLSKSKLWICQIVTCIILTLIFKVDWGIHFLGLEYEDAYSFSAFARQLSYQFTDGLRIQCVDIGSLNEPGAYGTYGGHFITYPSFLYLFTSIFGFSFTSISIINSLISFCALLTLSLFNYLNRFGWFFVILFFCLAPAINVFSTCFLSETFSSFIGISFIFAFFSRNNDKSIYIRILLYLAFVLSILTKRDNMILLIIPILFCLKELYLRNYKDGFKIIFPFIIILLVISVFIHNIFVAEIEEAQDINQSTFSISIFANQFPVYLRSIFDFKYFSIIVPIFILSVLLSFVMKINRFKVITLLTTIICFLLMYSSHYRGYYFINNLEEFSSFSTFRYINNFFYLFPICIGFSIINSKLYTSLIISLLLILESFSIYYTYSLRNEYSEDEKFARLNDVNIINSYLSKDSVIITDVPLLFLNTSSPDQNICDVRKIDKLNFASNFDFYLFIDDIATLNKRYGVNLDGYNTEKIIQLPTGKILYKISPKYLVKKPLIFKKQPSL